MKASSGTDKDTSGWPTKKMIAHQDAFLAAFILLGSVRAAGEAVGISREAVSRWNRNNVHGFRERYASAREDFVESLQDLAVSRVKEQKPGDNPVLLIALLNAHWPEKYRRTGYAVEGSGKEMIEAWKKWEKENKKSRTRERSESRDSAVEEAERILAKKSNPNQAGAPS